MMKALHEVVYKAGGSMSEASRNAVLGLIDDDSSDRTGNTYHGSLTLTTLG
jgi:hypothetical protein